MTWLFGFFKWLWDSIKNLGSFIVSIPTLIMGAVSVIFGSVVTLKSTVVAGSAYSDTIGQLGTQAAQNFQVFSQNLHDSFGIAVYALSLDVAFDVLLNVVTIILTISVSLLMFFFLTIPSFVITYYTTKGLLFVTCALIPSGWIPQGVINWVNTPSKLADLFAGSVADHAKHWYDGKWIR